MVACPLGLRASQKCGRWFMRCGRTAQVVAGGCGHAGARGPPCCPHGTSLVRPARPSGAAVRPGRGAMRLSIPWLGCLSRRIRPCRSTCLPRQGLLATAWLDRSPAAIDGGTGAGKRLESLVTRMAPGEASGSGRIDIAKARLGAACPSASVHAGAGVQGVPRLADEASDRPVSAPGCLEETGNRGLHLADFRYGHAVQIGIVNPARINAQHAPPPPSCWQTFLTLPNARPKHLPPAPGEHFGARYRYHPPHHPANGCAARCSWTRPVPGEPASHPPASSSP
jgi:hypothetical protein